MKHLKKIGLAIVIMLIMIPVVSGAEGLGNARLSLMDGDVQIRSEDSSDWLPASVNMPLRDGDSIWVPDGARAEVQVSGGTQVRLDELTSLDLLNISRDSSQFYLAEGSAYVNFRDKRSNGLVQIDTPVSSVRAYDRAAFNIDVAGNGDTDVSVYTGQVHAESRSGSTRVTAGNSLAISDDYADLAPLGRADAWERWNSDRDRMFEERRFSTRYLPDELETYASDFDDNGKWVSVRDYGHVWTPTVQVSVGWSPYRHGRWCWVGRDYVWIGYEPWGWAPYHYGRWAYAASVGWFWVPPARGSVYWGPGYVGWVRTPTYVAWVPLAPRETYYGHGNYGPYSVNLINVNINTIVVKGTYRNVHVTNGVTVVHRDTFVRGRQVDFKVRENPFLREKIHIGRPDIKPERESRMAIIRDIPKAKEPPRKIREIKVGEIKEKRPMVREREKSVLLPDRPGQQMRVKTVETPRDRKKDGLKERGRTFKGSERPQIEERGRVVTPAEKRMSDEKNERKVDRQGIIPKEKDSGSRGIAPAVEPSRKIQPRQFEPKDRQTEQPKQEAQPPDRIKKREPRPFGESRPEQPKVKQREREPVQQRQIQKQEAQPPERIKKREPRPIGESAPEQPRVKQREREPVQQRQIQKQEAQPPERIKKREPRPIGEGAPEQPNVKPRDREPVQSRQLQREERQQQQQPVKQDIRQDKRQERQKEERNVPQGGAKEERKKVQDEKEGRKPSGESSQQPPAR
ncbi:MAG: FecR domain-containing protein [Nitrospirae bacterium]|nr:FecR domain-containing protein [Nitrospirota bacterium]